MASDSGYGAATTTDEVLQGVDLSGRFAIVTGASGGLGAETARALASRGAHVTLAARNLHKTAAVVDAIRAAGGQADADALELTSHESVRAFAARYADTHDRLDWLVNNAGVMACPLQRTPEGWELQLATNHIGHFLLTGLLLPLLRAAKSARVVSLSSAAHLSSGVDFADPHFESRAYDKWVAYGQSKTANALFALELDRRLGGEGVSAYSVHPGVIMTELARNLSQDDLKAMVENRPPDAPPFEFKSVEAGAATSVWAATAAALEGHGGLYLEDCHVADALGQGRPLGVAPHAQDADAARRLWSESEKWVGQTFA